MRAVVTRVRSASVEIGGEIKSSIGQGFLVLLGVHEDDGEAEAVKIADKICGLRVFEDENGKMNLNPEAAGCPNLLIISQFTLFADCKSRRPGFSKAARPEKAIPLYEKVIAECRSRGFEVGTGEFGAEMKVESINDGPVTIILDTNLIQLKVPFKLVFITASKSSSFIAMQSPSFVIPALLTRMSTDPNSSFTSFMNS